MFIFDEDLDWGKNKIKNKKLLRTAHISSFSISRDLAMGYEVIAYRPGLGKEGTDGTVPLYSFFYFPPTYLPLAVTY